MFSPFGAGTGPHPNPLPKGEGGREFKHVLKGKRGRKRSRRSFGTGGGYDMSERRKDYLIENEGNGVGLCARRYYKVVRAGIHCGHVELVVIFRESSDIRN